MFFDYSNSAQIAAPVNYNDILNRCQSLLEKAHEARRADKAQNKKDVPVSWKLN